MDTIRIMIVDDRESVCNQMSAALEIAAQEEGALIRVVAVAFDGIEAVEKCDVFHPDVILMDLEMPGLGGLSAAKLIRKNHPRLPILAFTIHDSAATQLAVRDAGMKELISKGTRLQTIVRAIIRHYEAIPNNKIHKKRG